MFKIENYEKKKNGGNEVHAPVNRESGGRPPPPNCGTGPKCFVFPPSASY